MPINRCRLCVCFTLPVSPNGEHLSGGTTAIHMADSILAAVNIRPLRSSQLLRQNVHNITILQHA